jgi:hypothetical protein
MATERIGVLTRRIFTRRVTTVCRSACWRTNLIDVAGEEEKKAHALLKLCQSTHNGQWKRNYNIT